jgi:hypothetical protein
MSFNSLVTYFEILGANLKEGVSLLVGANGLRGHGALNRAIGGGRRGGGSRFFHYRGAGGERAQRHNQ